MWVFISPWPPVDLDRLIDWPSYLSKANSSTYSGLVLNTFSRILFPAILILGDNGAIAETVSKGKYIQVCLPCCFISVTSRFPKISYLNNSNDNNKITSQAKTAKGQIHFFGYSYLPYPFLSLLLPMYFSSIPHFLFILLSYLDSLPASFFSHHWLFLYFSYPIIFIFSSFPSFTLSSFIYSCITRAWVRYIHTVADDFL